MRSRCALVVSPLILFLPICRGNPIDVREYGGSLSSLANETYAERMQTEPTDTWDKDLDTIPLLSDSDVVLLPFSLNLNERNKTSGLEQKDAARLNTHESDKNVLRERTLLSNNSLATTFKDRLAGVLSPGTLSVAGHSRSRTFNSASFKHSLTNKKRPYKALPRREKSMDSPSCGKGEKYDHYPISAFPRKAGQIPTARS